MNLPAHSEDSDPAIELGGLVATLTVLRVVRLDLGAVRTELTRAVRSSPGLFNDAQLVIDLGALEGYGEASATPEDLPPPCEIALSELVKVIRAAGLCPLGVRDPRPERRSELDALGLASLSGGVRALGKRAVARASGPAPAGSSPAPEPASGSEQRRPFRLLEQPVRGGQVVYAEQADVVVVSSVNAGGEVIADGNIHVYGPLRGRALAGAHGDTTARVFCSRLDAELVSVAGVYLHAEQVPADKRGKAAQIYLDGDALVVADL